MVSPLAASKPMSAAAWSCFVCTCAGTGDCGWGCTDRVCCDGDIQLAPAPAPELSGDVEEETAPDDDDDEGRYVEEEEGWAGTAVVGLDGLEMLVDRGLDMLVESGLSAADRTVCAPAQCHEME
jgi:hypothetical protein